MNEVVRITLARTILAYQVLVPTLDGYWNQKILITVIPISMMSIYPEYVKCPSE